MREIRETRLPGVGLRHDFHTRRGERVGVVSHRTGRRDVIVYDTKDPDHCREAMVLTEEEAHTLAELLGGSRVAAHLAEELQQHIEGLAIDWLHIQAGSPAAGQPLSELRVRTRTGVLIVAALRGGDTIPAPGPEFVIEPGDTVFVVGPPTGIQQLTELLLSG